MLIAGIIGHDGKIQTASLISRILSSTGKKVKVVDSKDLIDLDIQGFKTYLQNFKKNNIDVLVIKIDVRDLYSEIFTDFHTDIMIYTDKTQDASDTDSLNPGGNMKRVMELMDEKSIAIVNMDDRELLRIVQGVKNHIITYGFNSKASMTTSSIGDAFICCLQRTIPTRNGVLVEPQEYRINVESSLFDSHNILAATTFAILNGVNPNSIDRVGLKM